MKETRKLIKQILYSLSLALLISYIFIRLSQERMDNKLDAIIEHFEIVVE